MIRIETVWTSTAMLWMAAVLVTGCGRSASPPAPEAAPAAAGQHFILAAEPAGAAGVIQVRQTAEDREMVVVVGRVGGSEKPWVEGRAAFSIVDPALEACSDHEDDNCPVPWDYCCETDRLPAAKVLVKFTDAHGQLIPQDARQLFPVKELQTVVVQGQAQRDESGNLTVLASGLFIRP